MSSRLLTRRLGDTIHLYSVLRHQPQVPLTVYSKYGFLFPDCPTGDQTGFETSPDFKGPQPNQHIRDTIAITHGVNVNLVKGPLWKCVQHPEKNSHPYLVLLPHGSDVRREWHAGKWKQVRQHLDAKGIAHHWCPGMQRGGPWLDLPDMVDLIAHAAGVIAIDSGPLHVADNFSIPTVGLYATTSTTNYGPYHSRHLCVDIHEAQWPKDKPYGTGFYNPQCRKAMNAITTHQVLEKLYQAVGGVFNL